MKPIALKTLLTVLVSCFLISYSYSQENSLYKKGKEALEKGNYIEAIDYFGEDLEERDYSYSALGLAMAYVQEHAYPEALAYYEESLTYEPKFDAATTKEVEATIKSLKNSSDNNFKGRGASSTNLLNAADGGGVKVGPFNLPPILVLNEEGPEIDTTIVKLNTKLLKDN